MNVGLYYQKCGHFGHVMTDCNALIEKDKKKVGSMGIVKSTIVLGESLTTPVGIEVERNEDNPEGLTIEARIEKDREVTTDPLVMSSSVVEKNGTDMEEYPFEKEIDDLLKSPIARGDTAHQTLEEGEIGTPQGDLMEEEVTCNYVVKCQVNSARTPLVIPIILDQK